VLAALHVVLSTPEMLPGSCPSSWSATYRGARSGIDGQAAPADLREQAQATGWR